jgi:hypothetical protein
MWKTSSQYKEFLPIVTNWRLARSKSSRQTLESTRSGSHAESSSSEGLLIAAPTAERAGGVSRGPINQSPEDPEHYEPEKDFNLHIMQYEVKETGGRDEDDKKQPLRIISQFSDRKIKIVMITGQCNAGQNLSKNNLLYKGEEPGRLSYIHLPANNISVSIFKARVSY